VRLPLELEVPGLFRFSASATLDGRPVEVRLRRGRGRLLVNGTEWATFRLEEGEAHLEVHPQLAKRMMSEFMSGLGWQRALRASPHMVRAMQKLADQSGTAFTFSSGGLALFSVRPGKRPSFHLANLMRFFGQSDRR